MEEKSFGLNTTSGKGSEDERIVVGGNIELLLLPPPPTPPLTQLTLMPPPAPPLLLLVCCDCKEPPTSAVVVVAVVLLLLAHDDDEDMVRSICAAIFNTLLLLAPAVVTIALVAFVIKLAEQVEMTDDILESCLLLLSSPLAAAIVDSNCSSMIGKGCSAATISIAKRLRNNCTRRDLEACSAAVAANTGDVIITVGEDVLSLSVRKVTVAIVLLSFSMQRSLIGVISNSISLQLSGVEIEAGLFKLVLFAKVEVITVLLLCEKTSRDALLVSK
ncbi:hypothetical protein GQX74_007395 [Glossina fuscipes]|nr:hypothetical protein GQX74_007395 [Glossina fuscipes]